MKKTIQISLKQQEILTAANDPTIIDLLVGGGAGGAKSATICIWMLLRCRDYPGWKIALGRKELTRLKQTTVATLLNKVHKWFGVTNSEFNYNDQKGLISYINGSSIHLIDLATQPSDPEFDTLGSLEYSDVVIEEAAEIRKKARDVLGARKNRWLNTEYGVPGKSILTCNPGSNFIRQEFYEPYKALGGGESRFWPNGNVFVNGERKTAYKGFIRALVKDNPFADKNYIEDLRKLPTRERARLLSGDWNFDTKENMIFTDLLIDRTLISLIPDEGNRFIGVDVADKGKDRTVVSLYIDDCLVKQQNLIVDTSGEKAISESTALELIKFAQLNGFTAPDAKNIAVDTVGVGVGVRDFMRAKGWFITEFVAGSAPSEPGYKNLRSEAYWKYSQDMDKSKTKIYSQLETLGDIDDRPGLRRQLKAHEQEDSDEDRVIAVRSKKKIKEDLGISPDEADSAVIGHWISKGGKRDPKSDVSRISW